MDNLPDLSASRPKTLMFPVLAGVCSGILLGYLEAFTLLAVQFGFKTQYVSAPIIWITPLFYAAVFGLIGLVISLLTRRFSFSITAQITLFIFAFLVATDMLEIAYPETLARYAKILLCAGVASVVARWLVQKIDWLASACRQSVGWLWISLPCAFVLVQGSLLGLEKYRVSHLVPVREGAPNVLVIVVDALRADHLRSYGYGRATSPWIDSLAQGGTRFANAFSTSSWTLPSHVSLFTGMNSRVHGIGREDKRIPKTLPTLAGFLRDRGYRTAAFVGNVFWVTHDRVGLGFIHFDDYFQSVWDGVLRTMYGRAFERFVMRHLGYENIPARRLATDINRLTLDWIDQDKRHPFFAFLNYFDVHDPYLAPAPFRTKFSAGKEVGGILNWRVGRSNPQITPEQLRGEIAAYDGGIAYVDEQIHHLLAGLAARSLDNTLVIVTSDHGEAFGEHGYYLHGNSLYRGQIQVPLIFSWPGHLPSGRVIEQPVTNAAIASSIAQLLGPDSGSFPIRPLNGYWTGGNTNRSAPLASTEKKRWAPKGSPARVGSLDCVLTPEWHFIQNESRPIELYRWHSDPDEKQNLANSTEWDATVTELKALLVAPRQTER